MRDVSGFHPELRRWARLLWRGGDPLRHRALIRTAFRAMSAVPRQGVAVVDTGEVSVRLHRPPGQTGPLPALLWIHGGGYVMGSPAQDDPLCRFLARRCNLVVAAVTYRLAPECPYPAGLDDCYAGLRWLARQAFVDQTRLAVGGASAGGGLAAALALQARDRDEVKLAFQLLSYPMLDDRTANRRELDGLDTRLWSNRSNGIAWRAYSGHEPGSSAVSALAAPARSQDLTGLPPAWIGVGTRDLFHDEDVQYAQQLQAAGVPVDLHLVEGAYHAFDALAGRTTVGRAFREAQVAALCAALHVGG